MNLRYRDLLPAWVSKLNLTGYIVIWNGYFDPQDYTVTLAQVAFTPAQAAAKQPSIAYDYTVYRNVNKTAPVLYIHDAESLGIGTDRLLRNNIKFITEKSLRNDNFITSDTYTLLRPPRFPYTTRIPKLSPKELPIILETLSFIEQKRYISMLICSMIPTGKPGRDVLEQISEYNIIINEENIHEYIHEGASHFGYKQYTYGELMKMHNTIVREVRYNIEGCLIPYNMRHDDCGMLYEIRSRIFRITKKEDHEYDPQRIWYNDLPFFKANIDNFLNN